MAIEEIDVDALAPLLDGGAVLLDVRERAEWAEVRVPGALHIPLGELPGRTSEVPEAEVLYVICRSGGRSMKACEHLATEGLTAVNVAGGTLAWVSSGRPTESGA